MSEWQYREELAFPLNDVCLTVGEHLCSSADLCEGYFRRNVNVSVGNVKLFPGRQQFFRSAIAARVGRTSSARAARRRGRLLHGFGGTSSNHIVDALVAHDLSCHSKLIDNVASQFRAGENLITSFRSGTEAATAGTIGKVVSGHLVIRH